MSPPPSVCRLSANPPRTRRDMGGVLCLERNMQTLAALLWSLEEEPICIYIYIYTHFFLIYVFFLPIAIKVHLHSATGYDSVECCCSVGKYSVVQIVLQAL